MRSVLVSPGGSSAAVDREKRGPRASGRAAAVPKAGRERHGSSVHTIQAQPRKNVGVAAAEQSKADLEAQISTAD